MDEEGTYLIFSVGHNTELIYRTVSVSPHLIVSESPHLIVSVSPLLIVSVSLLIFFLHENPHENVTMLFVVFYSIYPIFIQNMNLNLTL